MLVDKIVRGIIVERVVKRKHHIPHELLCVRVRLVLQAFLHSAQVHRGLHHVVIVRQLQCNRIHRRIEGPGVLVTHQPTQEPLALVNPHLRCTSRLLSSLHELHTLALILLAFARLLPFALLCSDPFPHSAFRFQRPHIDDHLATNATAPLWRAQWAVFVLFDAPQLFIGILGAIHRFAAQTGTQASALLGF